MPGFQISFPPVWPLRRHITTRNVTNKDDGTCYYKMTEPFNERSEGGKAKEKCEDACVRVLVGMCVAELWARVP